MGSPSTTGFRRALADLQAARPSGAMVAGATALVLAAAGGWWLGGASREQAPPPAREAVVAVGAFELGLESTWVSAASVPGLPVAGAEVLAPAPGLAERALLVTGPAADATLIPSALRSELPVSLPKPRRAALAGLPAWTYGPLRDEGRTLEVTVAPTTAGILALACSATSWSAWVDCGDGVHAVATGEAKALAPTAELAFLQAAGPVLGTLDAERVSGRARLTTRAPRGRGRPGPLAPRGRHRARPLRRRAAPPPTPSPPCATPPAATTRSRPPHAAATAPASSPPERRCRGATPR